MWFVRGPRRMDFKRMKALAAAQQPPSNATRMWTIGTVGSSNRSIVRDRTSMCAPSNDIILVAMADMNRVLRLMFDQVAERVPPWCMLPKLTRIGLTNMVAWFLQSGKMLKFPLGQSRFWYGRIRRIRPMPLRSVWRDFDGRYRADQVVIGCWTNASSRKSRGVCCKLKCQVAGWWVLY